MWLNYVGARNCTACQIRSCGYYTYTISLSTIGIFKGQIVSNAIRYV